MDFYYYLFFFLALVGSIFFWFVYCKSYRFSTVLFDLLPWYPLTIAVLAMFHLFLAKILFSDLLRIMIIVALTINYVIQFYKFYLWRSNYRLKKFAQLMENLSVNHNVNVLTIQQLLESDSLDPSKIAVLIRHDVDINLSRSQKMMEVETKLNIPSCYYFRNNAERYTLEQAIPLMEHMRDHDLFEVGFHYETISNAQGNLDIAKELFTVEVEELRKFVPLRMISAHGDQFRNRRLVVEKMVNLEELQLHSTYDLSRDYYISDAGGLHHFLYEGQKLTFLEKLTKLQTIPNGTIIQILIHPDWWF